MLYARTWKRTFPHCVIRGILERPRGQWGEVGRVPAARLNEIAHAAYPLLTQLGIARVL